MLDNQAADPASNFKCSTKEFDICSCRTTEPGSRRYLLLPGFLFIDNSLFILNLAGGIPAFLSAYFNEY
jgi:hypothetical protein